MALSRGMDRFLGAVRRAIARGKPFLLESTMTITTREIIHTPAVLQSMKCSRWKLWDLCRNDPDFPAPRMIAGKRSWFLDEIEDYKESRPRRQYADNAV